jgi:uncharacterized protein YndB with AHSA1/START domain
MDARKEGNTALVKPTTTKRKSDLEIETRRTFDAPARLVYQAWTKPELFKRWWVPRSMGMNLLSCDMDVRVGGKYRLVFGQSVADGFAFFGTYLEVVPHSRLVWTNEEGGDGGPITIVAFEEKDGKTQLTLTERHVSKKSLDDNLGASEALAETFGQLDELLESAEF